MPGDREPSLREAGDGLCVYFENRPLYPVENPRSKLVAKVSRLAIPSQSLVWVPGPLLFYGLEELVRLCPGSFVVTYEHEKKLRGLAPCPAGLKQMEELSEEALHQILVEIGPTRVRRVVRLALTGSASLHSQTYGAAADRLEEEIQVFWKNRLAAIRLGSLWIRNFFGNLARSAPQTFELPWIPNKRVVIAGAGPDLETALEDLRRYREEFFLVCVDTALRPLLEAHLRPDAVFALESQFWNVRDFAGFEPQQEFLWCDLTSHPGPIRVFGKNHRFFFTRFGPLKVFSRLQQANLLPVEVQPGGSVGVQAVLAFLNTSSPSLGIVGLDFSHPADKTHCRSSPAHLERLDHLHRLGTLGATPQKPSGLLSYYAQRLKGALTENHSRVVDLRRGGVDLGLTKKDWKSWISERETPSPTSFPPEKNREKIGVFLDGEIRRMEDLFVLFEDLNAGRDPKTLEEALYDLDYLYFAFPDGGGPPILETSFLSRAKASLNFHLAYFKNLRSLVVG